MRGEMYDRIFSGQVVEPFIIALLLSAQRGVGSSVLGLQKWWMTFVGSLPTTEYFISRGPVPFFGGDRMTGRSPRKAEAANHRA